jgi:hypothetical protein
MSRSQSYNPTNNESVQVTISSNTSNTNATPPGWNSGRRFAARWVLWFVVLTLLSGMKIWATIFSAMSIIILKEGTLFSGKNIKWIILSGISFLSSLGSWFLEHAYEVVDEDKAYSLKISLWLASKSMQVVWGMILALFLFSAATSKSSTSASTSTAISSQQPK